MGVTQSGVYSNGWVIADGNPSSKSDHMPPSSGRGRPQSLFSVLKGHDPSAKVSIYFGFPWMLEDHPLKRITNHCWANNVARCWMEILSKLKLKLTLSNIIQTYSVQTRPTC
jgi:hypothetical protein